MPAPRTAQAANGIHKVQAGNLLEVNGIRSPFVVIGLRPILMDPLDGSVVMDMACATRIAEVARSGG
jgi:hypothetical protein